MLVKQFHQHFKALLQLNYRLLRMKQDQRLQLYEEFQERIHIESGAIHNILQHLDTNMKSLDLISDKVAKNLKLTCDIVRQEQFYAVEAVQAAQESHSLRDIFNQLEGQNNPFNIGGVGFGNSVNNQNSQLDGLTGNFSHLGGGSTAGMRFSGAQSHGQRFDSLDFGILNLNQQQSNRFPTLDNNNIGGITGTGGNRTNMILNQIEGHFEQVNNQRIGTSQHNSKSLIQNPFFQTALSGHQSSHSHHHFDMNFDHNLDLNQPNQFPLIQYDPPIDNSINVSENNDDILYSLLDEQQNSKILGLKTLCKDTFKEHLYDMIVEIKQNAEAKLAKQNQLLEDVDKFLAQN
ncbi:UNKNOWN [Stylonychia lemnae]|uniref:Uncharacterized protein n=1 Tax=Stylonychia lemnae TaxID=5949 RepID=A0A078A8Z7_STYLE|nr:UNKNOWN [Stylonychia lemnae]|eukprot:CDW78346.1 UNKNOWN [Stylonychia lemnae]